jgi:predicted MPP superfamily phosphohydrolase
LSRIAFYNGLTVKSYTIPSDLISEPHTFVIVSDLHATEYGEDQSKLLRLIQKQRPDAVFMPGDMTHESRPGEPCFVLLKELSQISPCYLTVGNHERWTEVSSNIKETYAEHGVQVLSDRSTELRLGSDTFRIHGVDDPLFYPSEEKFREAVKNLLPESMTADGVFDILLSHRPEYAELYAEIGYDLTVSGHAHGGQVRLPPFLNGLYAPNQGWFPPYAGGIYETDHSHTVVSRGLMIDEIPRVFNPPEIVVITLIPSETEKP